MPPAVRVLGPDLAVEVALAVAAALLLQCLLLRHLQGAAGAAAPSPRQLQILGGTCEAGQVQLGAAHNQGCAGGIHAAAQQQMGLRQSFLELLGLFAHNSRSRVWCCIVLLEWAETLTTIHSAIDK